MIWCVEDDASIRDIEVYALRSTGFEAEGFEDGTSFWEALRTRRPELVVLDVMLPGIDGFEVCRSLRSNIKTSHIPVIMLSALGKNTENKIKALECGANVFIDKPFDMDFLLKQVANLIRTQQELKERYSKKYIAEPSKITISSMDEELLKKAMNYIERNMDNSDYNVDSFVSDMSIGRTLLYQKINDITGM